jgi:hypothetical protein
MVNSTPASYSCKQRERKLEAWFLFLPKLARKIVVRLCLTVGEGVIQYTPHFFSSTGRNTHIFELTREINVVLSEYTRSVDNQLHKNMTVLNLIPLSDLPAN